jgi:hypothetical protein
MVQANTAEATVDALPAETAAVPEEHKSIREMVDASGGGTNATFSFAHKVFRLPGARFALDERTRTMFFYAKLGSLDIAISPAVLKNEFGIADDSNDAQLIELAEKGLRYVTDIRPGDSVPCEILDGSASWKVEEQHLMRARAKLLTQVAGWIDSGATDISVLEGLLADGADALTAKEEIQNAFSSIAESLGIGKGRKQEVIDRVETFARELSYIEALRDHMASVQSIQAKVGDLAQTFRRDQAFSESLVRVSNLLKRPIAEFVEMFMQIDAQAGELLALLRNAEQQTDYIRKTRDDIHQQLMLWNEMLELWKGQPVRYGDPPEKPVRALYRFLATHYAAKVVWR